MDPREAPPAKRVNTPVSISFRFVNRDRFCLSQSQQRELRGVADCLHHLTTMTWMEVLRTGGSPGNKRGLAYTLYDDGALRGVTRPAGLDQTVRVAAIRASDKYRIFGACIDHVFYVLWFDRNHEIVPV